MNTKALEFYINFPDELMSFILGEDYFKLANMAQHKIIEIKAEH